MFMKNIFFIGSFVVTLMIIFCVFLFWPREVNVSPDYEYIKKGDVYWDRQNKIIEVNIVSQNNLQDPVEEFTLELYFEGGNRIFGIDPSDLSGSPLFLNLEEDLGNLFDVILKPLVNGREKNPVHLNFENIPKEDKPVENLGPTKTSSRKSSSSEGGSSGGSGGGNIPDSKPSVCSNDFGCSSAGNFCDGNLTYSCSEGADGCYDRVNVSECEELCLNGMCVSGLTCGTEINSGGQYYLTSNLYLQEDYTCIGILSSDVIIDCLEHFIDGNGTNNTVFYIANATNVTINNCTIFGMERGGESVVIYNSNHTKIYDSNFSDNDFGLFFAYSQFSEIANNTFSNRNASIWATYNSSGIEIKNNLFLNKSSNYAIDFNHLGNFPSLVENNYFEKHSTAINFFAGSGNDIIRNNNISRCYSEINVDDTGTLVENNTIVESEFGINVIRNPFDISSNSANVTIKNNHVYYSNFSAILIGKPINASFFNNTLNHGKFGIRGEAGEGNVLINNTILNFTTGLRLYTIQEGGFLLGNLIINNSRGLDFDMDFGNNATVENNRICGNSEDVYCTHRSQGFSTNFCSSGTIDVCGIDCNFCE